MKTAIPTSAVLAALLAAAPWTAAAADCMPEIRDAWLRKPPTAMPMLAGFARIENGCAAPVAVVSADSDAFGAVELHQTTVVEGVSRMRAVPRLEIEAGGAAALEPGGLHLMLMRPVREIAAGETIVVGLTLEDGRRIEAPFEVRTATAR